MAPPPPSLALTLLRTRWHFSSQYTSVPHCEHFILAPSASQLPQRPTALLLPSLVLPCALFLLFALPSPFLRGVPSAPPRSSGWGRWKTVGSYEAVVEEEEEREPSASGPGSSAAPFSLFVLRELMSTDDVVAQELVGDAMAGGGRCDRGTRPPK